MPEEIRAILELEDLRTAYEARPPYQRNDYIGWIERAVRPVTRVRRIDRMLDELRTDGFRVHGDAVVAPRRRRRQESPEGTPTGQDAL